MQIPLAFAFTAGMVATLNPCGFAMLPAYLSYYMGLDTSAETSPSYRGLEALKVGGVVSAGFLLVFGVAGALITWGVQTVVVLLPWIAMLVGVGVVLLGVALLAGKEFRFTLPRASQAPSGRGLRGVFAFGVSYAFASLSCTLPVFLVVVVGTIPQLGFFAGVTTFLVYGVGMSTLLLLVTIALAFGKQTVLSRLRRGTALVNRVSGGILVAAGTYIVFYWITSLSGTGLSQPGAVRWVEELSSSATNLVANQSASIGLTAAAVVLIASIAGWLGLRRRRHAASQGPHAEQILPTTESSDRAETPQPK